MKCPKCKAEIDYVGIITQHWQKGELEGNRIAHYGYKPGEAHYIDDSTVYVCPLCDEDITDSIEE